MNSIEITFKETNRVERIDNVIVVTYRTETNCLLVTVSSSDRPDAVDAKVIDAKHIMIDFDDVLEYFIV